MARVAASVFVRSLVLAIVAFAPAAAHADEGMLNSGNLVFQDLLIHLDGAEETTVPVDEDRREYFNLAHCVCGKAGAGLETEFEYRMTITGATTPTNRPADIWYGAECENDETRDMNCVEDESASIADLSTLQGMLVRKTFRVGDVIAPLSPSCPDSENNGHIWVLADIAGGGTYDYALSQEVAFDTQPAPAPINATAEGGESAVQVNWDAVVDRADDVAYYQALCARVDTGAPALVEPSHEPRYQTAANLCDVNQHEVLLTAVNNPIDEARFAPGPTPDAADVDAAIPDAAPTPDAVPSNLPEALQDLDPAYICGETTAPASSLRIQGLENDVEYRVVVVAIDLSGNASGVYFQNPLTPRPVTDFWEDLHDRGSEVEGGFCLVNATFGSGSWPADALRSFRDGTLADTAFGRWLTRVYYDVSSVLAPLVEGSLALRIVAGVLLAPLVVVALLWHALTLPGLVLLVVALVAWRRRRRTRRTHRVSPRLLAAALLVALVALGGTASAQSTDPYWDDAMFDDESGEEILDPHWHVGLRLGPYTPEIDEQLGGMGVGPYEAMFGDGVGVMPMLDVHWLFLRGFGQLGIGGSIGAMWKSAKAYKAGTDPNDPMRPRSEGDKTTFRLVPIEATATYRLTYFDDTYGVPLVPYIRGGLGYYVWWIGAPSGNTGIIYDPPGCDPRGDGCDGNRARGASIGVTGAIGLAIRAERIDPSATRGMRQGGVEHAGFYAELSLAKIDGFGNEKKLSVGDKTWFVGVDFEF
jgi:hypothetical protein